MDKTNPVATTQPRLTVRLTAFPESNGKRNWTALLVRVDKFDGLVGNCGGITIDRGECWNRVAYEAECARYLIGERDTEPHILDYGDDIRTPEEWAGEVRGGRIKRKPPLAQPPGWMPMATAPRDGTEILVVPDNGYDRALFQDGFWFWSTPNTDSIAAGPEPTGWKSLSQQ